MIYTDVNKNSKNVSDITYHIYRGTKHIYDYEMIVEYKDNISEMDKRDFNNLYRDYLLSIFNKEYITKMGYVYVINESYNAEKKYTKSVKFIEIISKEKDAV